MASIANDVILEQVEFTYDRGGNLIQTVTWRRYPTRQILRRGLWMIRARFPRRGSRFGRCIRILWAGRWRASSTEPTGAGRLPGPIRFRPGRIRCSSFDAAGTTGLTDTPDAALLTNSAYRIRLSSEPLDREIFATLDSDAGLATLSLTQVGRNCVRFSCHRAGSLHFVEFLPRLNQSFHRTDERRQVTQTVSALMLARPDNSSRSQLPG
jgi:hypothetical protein